jgi:hypothetical protein
MNPYSNSRKNRFFDRIPRTELDSPSCNIASRSKFNFSYVDESQEAGQIIAQWDERKDLTGTTFLKYMEIFQRIQHSFTQSMCRLTFIGEDSGSIVVSD